MLMEDLYCIRYRQIQLGDYFVFKIERRFALPTDIR